MAKKNVALLVIDMLNDFCDPKEGALYVKNAENDCSNLSEFVYQRDGEIENVYVFMDAHPLVSIWHPNFWVNKDGEHPGEYSFEKMTIQKVEEKTWMPIKEEWYDNALSYVKNLERGKKNPLCIWPVHCLIGTPGQNIFPIVNDAIRHWEIANSKNARYIFKGMNPFREHYSALKAEVPDLNDSSTLLNVDLVHQWSNADIILLTGEALSHCVASTGRDLAYELNPEDIKKIVLLSDTTSPVTGFEHLAEGFVAELTAKGMRVTTTKDFEV